MPLTNRLFNLIASASLGLCAGIAPALTAAEVDPELQTIHRIDAIVVTGDREAVFDLASWENLQSQVLLREVSPIDVEEFRAALLKAMQDDGYLFALVNADTTRLDEGTLTMQVSVGDMGELQIDGARFQRDSSLRHRLGWKEGQPFNYREMYARLVALNNRSDVQVETQLKPRQAPDGTRLVDVELSVRDRFPLVAGITFSNTGIREKEDWVGRLSLQTFDLIQPGDNLAVGFITNIENVNSNKSVYASYSLPITSTITLSAFGGFSDSFAEDVIELIDVVGEGYYGGFGVTNTFYESRSKKLDITFGYHYIQSSGGAEFSGTDGATTRISNQNVRFGLPRITISYADKEFDRTGGRTFFSATALFSFSDQLGTMSEGAMRDLTLRNNTGGTVGFEADEHFILRVQALRYQAIGAPPGDPMAIPLLLRFDGQFAEGHLPDVLQKAVGGLDTVRGYDQSQKRGDSAVVASIEVRTPKGLIQTPQISGVSNDDFNLQFAAFFDYGNVWDHRNAARGEFEPDRADLDIMLGVGVGVRLQVTRHLQGLIDVAKPLRQRNPVNTTSLAEEDPFAFPNDRGWRVHAKIQLQY